MAQQASHLPGFHSEVAAAAPKAKKNHPQTQTPRRTRKLRVAPRVGHLIKAPPIQRATVTPPPTATPSLTRSATRRASAPTSAARAASPPPTRRARKAAETRTMNATQAPLLTN